MLRIVNHPRVAVKQTFGRFREVLAPGWHFYVPILTRLFEYDTRVVASHKVVTTKTRDNVFCDLKLSTFSRVVDAAQRHYSCKDPDDVISTKLEDNLRNMVASLKIDDLFMARNVIQTELRAEIMNVANLFGLEITGVAITDIEPDPKVKQAMNQVNAATREREAAEERALAKKVALVKEAEADAERKKLQGQGIANMRKAIIDGYKGSVSNMAQTLGISPKEAIAMTLTTQYVEALSDLAKSPNTKVLFYSQDASHTIQDVSKQFGWLMMDKVIENKKAYG